MKLTIHAMPLAALLLSAPLLADDALDARRLIQTYAATLQTELKSALSEGGPTQAVGVCQERAPAIAAELAERSGWSIGRVSSLPRNPTLNTPDDWERRVLAQFEDRKRAGTAPDTLRYAEVVMASGRKRYRYMQAIPTDAVCLACHGGNISAEVSAALAAAYPDDRARGYATGDLRGAFTLSKPY